MDNKKIFEMLTSVIWQDFKGFKREEWKTYRDDFDISVGPTWLLIIPGVNVVILAVYVISVAVLLLVFIYWLPMRYRVSAKTYDIEVTTSEYKITRNKKGKIGLCHWYSWLQNKLLLKPKFNKITRVDNDCFIVSKDGKYGIYNGPRKKMVLKCEYDRISHLHDNVYETVKGSQISKHNTEGDRILV